MCANARATAVGFRFDVWRSAALLMLLPALVASLLVASLVVARAVVAAPLSRALDPVVLRGAGLVALAGTPPASVVAFRYQGGWLQIPVQIDERMTVPFDQVYNGAYTGALVDVETYTDPGTYVGADTDPGFDTDDELVFMAGDAGTIAPSSGGEPAGVLAGSGLELRITDPIDGGVGYVYLFVSDGSLLPGAGADYVTYQFNLLAGTYPANYNLMSGPNPENTNVTTARYSAHFSDRWIQDAMRIAAGGAGDVDILDRHRNIFARGSCLRSEDTFSHAEGAFFANVDGPVRAIRSYMGANSGPFTERTHIFYEGRQDITTDLRVHAIPGMIDMFDHSPAAVGMTYYDSNNPSGFAVDGVPDTPVAAFPSWTMLTGAQGTLVVAGMLATDVTALPLTLYYEDDSTPPYTQCTGDAFEYGANGVWINGGIPNTDPRTSPYNTLEATRVVYYEAPGKTPADAQLASQRANTPLSVGVTPFAAAVPGLSLLGLGLLAAALAAFGALAGKWRREA